MKVDIVVAYFEPAHRQWWEALSWGFELNAAHINRVIVVNDGEWAAALPTHASYKLVQLSHPKEGFGLSRSLNIGLAEAETDFVLVMEGDEVLAPCLETALEQATKGCLIALAKAYIDPTTLPAWIAGKSLPTALPEPEHRYGLLSRGQGRQWVIASGGHLLVDLATHRSLGGFDEDYGYGLHDFDYAARWMLANGDDAVRFAPKVGQVWHIGTGRGRKNPPPKAWRRLVQTLAPLYGHRYHLACGDKFDPTCLNVDMYLSRGADVFLDCRRLSFIQQGTAQHIWHAHFLEHLPPAAARLHLEDCFRALAPGGTLYIECPDLEVACQRYLQGRKDEALQALYSDPARNAAPGWAHLWGYDQERLKALLESVGFDVDYAGRALRTETCRERDLGIEATKPEEELP